MYVLQRERDVPEMNAYITDLRAKSGVRTIDRGSATSARDMIQAVRRGGMIAFVIDQNIRTESVKVPFFGRPALTPIGPASFAVRTEAAVVPAVIERLPDGRHHAEFHRAILSASATTTRWSSPRALRDRGRTDPARARAMGVDARPLARTAAWDVTANLNEADSSNG